MTALHSIAVDRQSVQPWRNGGGRTRVLFTWPGPAGDDAAWQLRLSVADIDTDGPFSAFDGVDRWLAVLQGAGLRLGLPGRLQVGLQVGTTALTLHSPPLQFAGEAAPGCWLADGPTRDFNLMLRRGAGTAMLQDARPGQPWTDTAPLRGLFSTASVQLLVDGATPVPVPPWTLVLGHAAGGQRWCVANQPGTGVDPHARLLWLAFTPSAAAA